MQGTKQKTAWMPVSTIEVYGESSKSTTSISPRPRNLNDPARIKSRNERHLQRPLIWRLLKSETGLKVTSKLCNLVAKVIKPPVLTPRQNTARCYETLFDPLCADTGVWPDYTEGYYPTGKETYSEAQALQIDFILEKVGCGPDTRLMDLGCGNGRLLRRAQELGASATGITVAATQRDACRADGLDVHLCSFEKIQERFERETFDIVVLNGPTEHFVTELDALEGRAEDVHSSAFQAVSHLLAPGGRVFITAMHFRGKEPDVHKVLQPALEHPVESDYFYYSNLVAIYSGWYTVGEAFIRAAAEQGLEKVFERDGTEDYFLTSLDWRKRLRNYIRRNPGEIARYLMDFFLKDPPYFFQAYLFFIFDIWTWQFRGGDESPIHHRWMMFARPPRGSLK